jgi:hypothetical protein
MRGRLDADYREHKGNAHKGTSMRQLFLTLAASVLAIGGLAGFTAPATAQDPWHGRYHDDLEHREFHRYLDHRDAHRYPMTWGQHEQLHDQLDHEAFHDRLEHRQFHRDSYQPYQSYYPYGGSYSSPYQGYGYGGSYYQPYQSYYPYQGYSYGGSYYQPSYGYGGTGFGIQGRRFAIYFGQ